MRRRTFLNSLCAGSACAVAGTENLHAEGCLCNEGEGFRTFGESGRRALDNIYAATSSLGNRRARDVAQDEDFWNIIQQSFSVSRSVVNLNNAGLNCCPKVVTDAILDLTMEQEKLPPYTAFTTLPPRLEVVRTSLADLLACDREEVAIVRNATEALQTVLLGIEMEPGDEILTTSHDYWAMMDGLEQRRRREGIQVKHVPVPAVPGNLSDLTDAVTSGITDRTRLILISHQVNLTGQIFPVKEISDYAHARGIQVAVDGAQSLAQFEFDMQDLDCDYFGTSLHKWLMAPKGTGLLYVKKDLIRDLWPLLPPPGGLENDVRKFEALGTIPATSLAIGEAIVFHNAIGATRKQARLEYLTRYWVDRVATLPNVRFNTSFEPGMSCAIATVDVESVDPRTLLNYLWDEHRIRVANPTQRADNVRGIRVSPGLQTTLEELDVFCEVMDGVVRTGI